jgi:hypothetical protein
VLSRDIGMERLTNEQFGYGTNSPFAALHKSVSYQG